MSQMNDTKNICKKSCMEPDTDCGIQHPHPHDVLSGRGSLTNLHIGNINFRQLVEYNKKRYASSMKQHKMIVSKSIVKAIRNQDPPGRFLQFDPCTGLWKEIGNSRALSKTSQTLRETPTIYAKLFDADFLSDGSELNKIVDNDGLIEDSSGTKQATLAPKTSEEGQCEPKSSLAKTKVLPENDKGSKNSDFFFFCEALKKLPENNCTSKINAMNKPASKKVNVLKKVDASSTNQITPFPYRRGVVQDTNSLTLKKSLISPNESKEFLPLMSPSTDLNLAARNFCDNIIKRPLESITRKVTLDGNQLQRSNKRTKFSTLIMGQNDSNVPCRQICQRSLSSSKYNPFRRHIFVSQGLNGMTSYNGEYHKRMTEPIYQSHTALRIENSPFFIRPFAVKDEVRFNLSTDPLSFQSLSTAHTDSLAAPRNIRVIENRKQIDPLSNSTRRTTNGNSDVVPFEVYSSSELRETMIEAGDGIDSNTAWYKEALDEIETRKESSVAQPYCDRFLDVQHALNLGNQISTPMISKHFPFASNEAKSR